MEKDLELINLVKSNIRKYRLSKNISIQELAYRCDVERTAISRIERIGNDFKISTLKRIADALEIRIVDLLEN